MNLARIVTIQELRDVLHVLYPMIRQLPTRPGFTWPKTHPGYRGSIYVGLIEELVAEALEKSALHQVVGYNRQHYAAQLHLHAAAQDAGYIVETLLKPYLRFPALCQNEVTVITLLGTELYVGYFPPSPALPQVVLDSPHLW